MEKPSLPVRWLCTNAASRFGDPTLPQWTGLAKRIEVEKYEDIRMPCCPKSLSEGCRLNRVQSTSIDALGIQILNFCCHVLCRITWETQQCHWQHRAKGVKAVRDFNLPTAWDEFKAHLLQVVSGWIPTLAGYLTIYPVFSLQVAHFGCSWIESTEKITVISPVSPSLLVTISIIYAVYLAMLVSNLVNWWAYARRW